MEHLDGADLRGIEQALDRIGDLLAKLVDAVTTPDEPEVGVTDVLLPDGDWIAAATDHGDGDE